MVQRSLDFHQPCKHTESSKTFMPQSTLFDHNPSRSHGARERSVALLVEEPLERLPGEVECAVLARTPGGSPGLITPHPLFLDVDAEHLNLVPAAHLGAGGQRAFAI